MIFQLKSAILSLTLAFAIGTASAVFAQPAVQSSAPAGSPLQVQAEALAFSPTPVRYEFLRQSVPRLATNEAAFRHMAVEDQRSWVLKSYYVAAFQRALILHRGDPELVGILERLSSDGSNVEQITKEFEQSYRVKFGVWPPIVPVDVDALIGRMLDASTIR